MKRVLYTFIFLAAVSSLSAQIVEVVSSNEGIILPRVASTDNVTSPSEGMIVYQTAAPKGLFQYDGTTWSQVGGAASSQPQMFTAFTPVFIAGQTRYGIFGQNNATTIRAGQVPMSQAGTVDDFCVVITEDVTSGANIVVTLMNGDTPTGLSVTFSDSDVMGTKKCDTGAESFEVGDLITVRFAETNSVAQSPLATLTCSMNFTAN